MKEGAALIGEREIEDTKTAVRMLFLQVFNRIVCVLANVEGVVNK